MGITMQEANDIVRQLLAALSAAKAQHGFKRTDKFYICYDHATVHNQVAAVLGNRALIWPQPSHSPDCNKPIEHVHGQLDAKMKSWLVELRQQQPNAHPTPQQCKDQLRAFFNSITPASINADVATLPATWQAIVNNDGGYVAGKLS